MDFFTHQDKARRNTGWLVVLFLLAIAALIMLTNLLIGFTLWVMTEEENMQRGLAVISQTDTGSVRQLLSWKLFSLISLGVVGAVACAVIYKWAQLSDGGKAVAESLGGRRIYPDSEDPDERQVLNVVEEMALAAGMPVPAVYLLEHELGVNAFAAGNSPADAVIGVTRGCIQLFKRDELQGVIAHEFSHIFNGDMRLNLRLIALLHGIVFIGMVGELIFRGSSRSRRSDGRVAILGLALMVIGWLGTFFGGLIKAAVSRQREYLADASAVQFTRNPNGIGNALKLIGGYSQGSEIASDQRSEMSHLFFGQVIKRMSDMAATHPPLVDRILKIDPQWDGNYLYRGEKTRQQKITKEVDEQQSKKERFLETVTLGTVVASGSSELPPLNEESDLEQLRFEIDGIPEQIREHIHDPMGAIALCYALLLHHNGALRTTQLGFVEQSGFKGITVLTEKLHEITNQLHLRYRLPLIELALPALRVMSEPQFNAFKRCLMSLIRADRKTELFEWCLYQLVYHYLSAEFDKKPVREKTIKQVADVSDEYQLILSLLAYHGHADENDRERAFNRGATAAGLYNISLLADEQLEVDRFAKAVNRIGSCQPSLKPRLLNGLILCVTQDGKVTIEEREIVSAIAAATDAPLALLNGLSEQLQ